MNNHHKKSVESFLLSGDIAAAKRWAIGLAKSEKASFAASILTEFKKFYEYSEQYSLADSEAIEREVRSEILKVCFFATAGLSLLKKAPWYSLPDTTHIVDIVKATQPDWIDDWVNWCLRSYPRDYRIVAPLLAQGLCSYPSHDHYILGFIDCFAGDSAKQQTLAAALKSQPQLLTRELWQLFEVEGGVTSTWE